LNDWGGKSRGWFKRRNGRLRDRKKAPKGIIYLTKSRKAREGSNFVGLQQEGEKQEEKLRGEGGGKGAGARGRENGLKKHSV